MAALKSFRTFLIWALLAYYEALIAIFFVKNCSDFSIYISAFVVSSTVIFFLILTRIIAGKAKEQIASCIYFEIDYSLEYRQKTEFRLVPRFFELYIAEHVKDLRYYTFVAVLSLLNAIGVYMYHTHQSKLFLLPLFLVLFSATAIEAVVLKIKILFLREDFI